MNYRFRALLLISGLTILPALSADPDAVKPIPKTVPTAVRLNNDTPYVKALEDLLADPPAEDADTKQKADHAVQVAMAAFNARKYDVAEQYNRKLLSYYSPEDEKEKAWFISLLHADLSCNLGKQGKFVDAEKEARRALEIDPSSLHARLILLSWLWELGKREEAVAMIKAVKEPADAKQKRIFFACQACFHATAENEDAVKENIKRFLELAPELKVIFLRDVVYDPYRSKSWFIELVGETLAK